MSRVPANVKRLMKENNAIAAAKEHSQMLHTGNIAAGWHEKDFQVSLYRGEACLCLELCCAFEGVSEDSGF